MSARIAEGLGVPVVKIARIAGQFAKPRTSESRDARRRVAARLSRRHHQRPRIRCRKPDADPAADAAGASGVVRSRPAARGDRGIDTSHEALLLPYEQALTRRDDEDAGGRYRATLWLGDRTRQRHGAHVEFLRGIANPIGIKIGPDVEPDELLRLCETLDPGNRPGRLMLIGRFGAGRMTERLPRLMRATRAAGLTAVWMSDPMHGNTCSAAASR